MIDQMDLEGFGN